MRKGGRAAASAEPADAVDGVQQAAAAEALTAAETVLLDPARH